MATLRLIEKGIAKFVVTSNHDNLHRKSGVKDDQIAELFGNACIHSHIISLSLHISKYVQNVRRHIHGELLPLLWLVVLHSFG